MTCDAFSKSAAVLVAAAIVVMEREEALAVRLRLTWYARKALEGRPEVDLEYVHRVIANPYRVFEQSDGRLRLWGYIAEQRKWLRVVVLADGSVFNAFFDRGFKP